MMENPLVAALSDKPWAVSGLIYGIDDLVDDEGRPVSERRAPSAVKKGVPMELRQCPYADERHGQPMNVSALGQITRYLDAVLDDIRAFRSSLPGADGEEWTELLTTVIDQLAGPAVHLLRSRGASPPIAARRAVGHKLAAGYFGVARGVLVAEARGERPEVSVEGLHQFVRESRALIGASEVCAGPPHMIAQVSGVLLHGKSEERAAPDRVSLAETLSAQVAASVAWELFDQAIERRLLLEDAPGAAIRPRTATIRAALAERTAHVAEARRPATEEDAARAVPATLGVQARAQMRAMLGEGGLAAPEHAGAARVVADLLDRDEGAVERLGGDVREQVARRLAGYLLAYRSTVSALFQLELRMRAILGYSPDVPMKLNGVVFPLPRCVLWVEALLGHRLRCEPSTASELVLANHRRAVNVA